MRLGKFLEVFTQNIMYSHMIWRGLKIVYDIRGVLKQNVQSEFNVSALPLFCSYICILAKNIFVLTFQGEVGWVGEGRLG